MIQVRLSDTSQAPTSRSEAAVPGRDAAWRRQPATQMASGTTASGTENLEPRTCQTLTATATSRKRPTSMVPRRGPCLPMEKANTARPMSGVT